jgi:hypothetical protein
VRDAERCVPDKKILKMPPSSGFVSACGDMGRQIVVFITIKLFPGH